MVVKCTCVHKEQDRLHGDGMRVANPLKPMKSMPITEYRCTVCLAIVHRDAGKE